MTQFQSIGIILFNDGHVLHLRPETVVIHRQKNMVLDDDCDSQMISRDECNLNFLTFILKLRKIQNKHQPGNWPDRWSNPGPLGERQWHYPSITVVVIMTQHSISYDYLSPTFRKCFRFIQWKISKTLYVNFVLRE